MSDARAALARIAEVPVDLTVEVARTLAPLGATLDFQEGSIVPLNKLATEPVEVRVAGRLVALGEVVVIDDEFGVRVTELVVESVSQ